MGRVESTGVDVRIEEEETAPKAQSARPIHSSANSPVAEMWLALGFDGRKQWQSTDQKGVDDTKLFEVKVGSDEHARITADFNKTLGFLGIDSIKRVENGYQHEQYSVHAKAIEAKWGSAFTDLRRI